MHGVGLRGLHRQCFLRNVRVLGHLWHFSGENLSPMHSVRFVIFIRKKTTERLSPTDSEDSVSVSLPGVDLG